MVQLACGDDADTALAAVLLDCLPGFAGQPGGQCGRDAAASPLASSVSTATPAPLALRLAEDALVSQCGAVAVQLPTRGRCAAANSGAPRCRTTVAGVLWHSSRGWLAVRLLLIVSLCRGLQAIVRHLRAAPHACAVLTDLYTHTLTRPTPRPAAPPRAAASSAPVDRVLQALPPLPPPALGVFVGSWSSAHAAVQEAAQLIVSACTAPMTLGAADAAAMHARTGFQAAGVLDGVRGADALRDLSTRGERGGAPLLFGWEVVPNESNGSGAEDTPHAPMAMLPQEVLGILREAPQHAADPMQVSPSIPCAPCNAL